jgi:hypothetical protein
MCVYNQSHHLVKTRTKTGKITPMFCVNYAARFRAATILILLVFTSQVALSTRFLWAKL